MLIKFIKEKLLNSYIMFKGETSDKRIALTFDDGPHVAHTKSILNILRNANVKATFFVVGKEVEKYPELVKEMSGDRHEIANHSYSHTNRECIKDIEKTEHLITGIAGGSSSRLFRPPWGKITLVRLRYVIFNKMKFVLWSFDSMDHKVKTPQDLRDYIRNSEIRPGEILLFHEDYTHTIEALPDIIADLKSRGFRFSTVSELSGSRP